MYITIFTPTYNRAKYLTKLYASLKNQKLKNFEWLIIDDDSTDNTEDVVKEFKNENCGFPIVFVKQTHGGKHRAINKAVQIAKGRYFFIVDSDDYLTEDATDFIFQNGSKIYDDNRYAGLSGLKILENGNVCGGNVDFLGKEYVDATNLEREKYRLYGDKAEVYKTSIIKKYPFPEFEGEFFITENVVWNQIAKDGYLIRWFQKPIYICEYLDGGLTKSGANDFSGHIQNFKGYTYFIVQSLKIQPRIDSIIYFRNYNLTCKKMKMPLTKRAHNLNMHLSTYLFYFLIEQPFFYFLRHTKKK